MGSATGSICRGPTRTRAGSIGPTRPRCTSVDSESALAQPCRLESHARSSQTSGALTSRSSLMMRDGARPAREDGGRPEEGAPRLGAARGPSPAGSPFGGAEAARGAEQGCRVPARRFSPDADPVRIDVEPPGPGAEKPDGGLAVFDL